VWGLTTRGDNGRDDRSSVPCSFFLPDECVDNEGKNDGMEEGESGKGFRGSVKRSRRRVSEHSNAEAEVGSVQGQDARVPGRKSPQRPLFSATNQTPLVSAHAPSEPVQEALPHLMHFALPASLT